MHGLALHPMLLLLPHGFHAGALFDCSLPFGQPVPLHVGQLQDFFTTLTFTPAPGRDIDLILVCEHRVAFISKIWAILALLNSSDPICGGMAAVAFTTHGTPSLTTLWVSFF